jgi:hypothetical protein
MLLASGPVLAQNDKVASGPPPAWAPVPEPLAVPADVSGLVFVRNNDSVVRLDDKGQTNHLAFRIKLLHPNALQLGNLQVGWNPMAGAPVVHHVRVHRDGDVIDVLGKTAFEILRREDQLEAARLDGNLTAVLRVPDLRVGDELEFAVTLPGNDPTMKDRSAGLLPLASELAPGRSRLALMWSAGQEPQVRVSRTSRPRSFVAGTGSAFGSTIPLLPTGPRMHRHAISGSGWSSIATSRIGPRCRGSSPRSTERQRPFRQARR